MEKLYRDRDWLYKHYIAQRESMRAIAREAKCDAKTVCRWLCKMNIPARSIDEGVFLARRNSVIITSDFLEFLRGEILGDGCVSMMGSRSARYTHSSKYEEYLIWLSRRFAEWGIEQVGQINRYKDKRTGAIGYKYTSRSYPELVPIRQRWYPNGKKIVPQDLELTPIMARQWYLGDGGLENSWAPHPNIGLSTCDFDWQSIKHLIEELNRLGFRTTHRPSNNTIGLSVHSVQDFLEWIGPCPVPCYNYRWGY